MRYVGSKRNIAKKIASEIINRKGDRTRYWEPFVGGMNSFSVVAPNFQKAYASDSHPDVILMWEALYNGWEPPENILKEDYERIIRASEPSALRGIVGFGASFGGKWKGGYAQPSTKGHSAYYYEKGGTDYQMTVRSVKRQIKSLPPTQFLCANYWERHGDTDMVIYCDPPYQNTTSYRGTAKFNYTKYHKWCLTQHEDYGSLIFMSGYEAPSDFVCVAEFSHNSSLTKASNAGARIERLFVPNSQESSRRYE